MLDHFYIAGQQTGRVTASIASVRVRYARIAISNLIQSMYHFKNNIKLLKSIYISNIDQELENRKSSLNHATITRPAFLDLRHISA
jgi:hypothetical protein